jgi:predicted transcriptional regulator
MLLTSWELKDMSIAEYKENIKKLIDATDNETLLRHWKMQLERDIEHSNEIELNEDEWNLVQEGLADYNAGEVISLEEFISGRK